LLDFGGREALKTKKSDLTRPGMNPAGKGF
jgi:hypothetical protein